MECISEINFGQCSLVLVESNVKAVEEIVSVCSAEHGAILETSAVSIGICVVLNSLDNVTESLFSELFFSHNDMHVVDVFSDV